MLGIAAIAAVVVVVVVSSGGSDDSKPRTEGKRNPQVAACDPGPQDRRSFAAAKAAGCVVKTFPNEGVSYEDITFTPWHYKTNPPTSGNHTPDGGRRRQLLSRPSPANRQDSCTRSSTAASSSSTSPARRRRS